MLQKFSGTVELFITLEDGTDYLLQNVPFAGTYEYSPAEPSQGGEYGAPEDHHVEIATTWTWEDVAKEARKFYEADEDDDTPPDRHFSELLVAIDRELFELSADDFQRIVKDNLDD